MNTENDPTFQGVWDELLWRGLVKDISDDLELRKLLNTQQVTFYCGFDPTAPSLHVGNLLQLLTMRRLQQAGHNPLVLVGGSTGLIGDPRPTEERSLQSKETVAGWVDRLGDQVKTVFTQPVEVVNNLDWFADVSAIDFLRDVGKFFTVNTMLRKKSVQSRLNNQNGISFTEFAYQLLQGNDFLQLFQQRGCILQTGGSDQWGNMTGGMDLVHSATGERVHAFSTPLVMNSDGSKFGKSEGNAVWLDPALTSPFMFFQFWLNTADADVFNRMKQFTFLPRETIEELELSNRVGEAQRLLAVEVTSLVHGEVVAEQMREVSELLFGKTSLQVLPEEVLWDVFNVLQFTKIASGVTVAAAACTMGIATSISDARRLVKQQGLRLNNTVVKDSEAVITKDDFLHGKFLLLRRGKKQLSAAVVED